MSSSNKYLAALLAVGVLGSFSQAKAESFVNYWSADSGLRPDQTSPYWILNDDTPSSPPTISGNAMTLSTHPKANREFYYFGPDGITMPDKLEIEFSAKFDSAVTGETIFSPVSVYFCIGSGLGGAFYLGGDDVWLAGQNQSRAVSSVVDTDGGFHTYRIELTGNTPGSMINVYYDNGVSPLISSPIVNDQAVYGHIPQIGFGDSSLKDSGVSEWEYLWHNAACVPMSSVPETTSLALVGAGLLIFGSRKFTARK